MSTWRHNLPTRRHFSFSQIGISVHPLAAHLSQSFTNLNVQIHYFLLFFFFFFVFLLSIDPFSVSINRSGIFFSSIWLGFVPVPLPPHTFLIYCSFQSHDLRIFGLYWIFWIWDWEVSFICFWWNSRYSRGIRSCFCWLFIYLESAFREASTCFDKIGRSSRESLV